MPDVTAGYRSLSVYLNGATKFQTMYYVSLQSDKIWLKFKFKIAKSPTTSSDHSNLCPNKK